VSRYLEHLELDTFTIAARDPARGMVGVCTSTKVPAVGAITTYASAGAGAVVTQARANPLFGVDGLELLRRGHEAADVIRRLLDGDNEPERRQLMVVPEEGGIWAHTGSGTDEWRGHRIGEHYVVAGNLLVGEETLTAMERSFLGSPETLPEGLVAALEAGQAAGGDSRGKQSAALYVVRAAPYPYVDLRVDDHPDPVAELRRLYELAKTDLLPLVEALPTRKEPESALGEDIRGDLIPDN
jgi:uncharacterized Ntn-hydrolase superfamily protein